MSLVFAVISCDLAPYDVIPPPQLHRGLRRVDTRIDRFLRVLRLIEHGTDDFRRPSYWVPAGTCCSFKSPLYLPFPRAGLHPLVARGTIAWAPQCTLSHRRAICMTFWKYAKRMARLQS